MLRAKAKTIGILLAGLAAADASAAVLYAENFDDPGFKGVIELPGSQSDKYAAVDYSTMNDFHGWTFTGPGTAYALNAAGTDGAVNLNEWGLPESTAATTVGGLQAGAAYKLSFLAYGDNIVGGNWELDVAVDGQNRLNLTGVVQPGGTNPGTIESIVFIAQGATTTLLFSQCCSVGGASPIFDNVTVASTPIPGTFWLLFPAVGALK